MGRPDREPLHEKVEVDETYVGGSEGGLRGGRERLNKTRVVGAVGDTRDCFQVGPDASGPSLTGFVKLNVKPWSIVVTDGWPSYASPRGDGIPPSPAHPEGSETGREGVAAGPSCFRDPQHLAARDSPWGPTPPSPGLPGRVHLPLQPAPDSDGSRSHPARPREPAATHYRHPVGWGGVNRIGMPSLMY
jgi:ISXO2-like transposase domain